MHAHIPRVTSLYRAVFHVLTLYNTPQSHLQIRSHLRCHPNQFRGTVRVHARAMQDMPTSDLVSVVVSITACTHRRTHCFPMHMRALARAIAASNNHMRAQKRKWYHAIIRWVRQLVLANPRPTNWWQADKKSPVVVARTSALDAEAVLDDEAAPETCTSPQRSIAARPSRR